ncbi:hypothetical protein A2U01_0074304, partial [Trifolium medium]|nr:hypothetical protein [Trifolium medium]
GIPYPNVFFLVVGNTCCHPCPEQDPRQDESFSKEDEDDDDDDDEEKRRRMMMMHES